MGQPHNVSLGPYLPQAELSITYLTELTTLECLDRRLQINHDMVLTEENRGDI